MFSVKIVRIPGGWGDPIRATFSCVLIRFGDFRAILLTFRWNSDPSMCDLGAIVRAPPGFGRSRNRDAKHCYLHAFCNIEKCIHEDVDEGWPLLPHRPGPAPAKKYEIPMVLA